MGHPSGGGLPVPHPLVYDVTWETPVTESSTTSKGATVTVAPHPLEDSTWILGPPGAPSIVLSTHPTLGLSSSREGEFTGPVAGRGVFLAEAGEMDYWDIPGNTGRGGERRVITRQARSGDASWSVQFSSSKPVPPAECDTDDGPANLGTVRAVEVRHPDPYERWARLEASPASPYGTPMPGSIDGFADPAGQEASTFATLEEAMQRGVALGSKCTGVSSPSSGTFIVSSGSFVSPPLSASSPETCYPKEEIQRPLASFPYSGTDYFLSGCSQFLVKEEQAGVYSLRNMWNGQYLIEGDACVSGDEVLPTKGTYVVSGAFGYEFPTEKACSKDPSCSKGYCDSCPPQHFFAYPGTGGAYSASFHVKFAAKPLDVPTMSWSPAKSGAGLWKAMRLADPPELPADAPVPERYVASQTILFVNALTGHALQTWSSNDARYMVLTASANLTGSNAQILLDPVSSELLPTGLVSQEGIPLCSRDCRFLGGALATQQYPSFHFDGVLPGLPEGGARWSSPSFGNISASARGATARDARATAVSLKADNAPMVDAFRSWKASDGDLVPPEVFHMCRESNSGVLADLAGSVLRNIILLFLGTYTTDEQRAAAVTWSRQSVFSPLVHPSAPSVGFSPLAAGAETLSGAYVWSDAPSEARSAPYSGVLENATPDYTGDVPDSSLTWMPAQSGSGIYTVYGRYASSTLVSSLSLTFSPLSGALPVTAELALYDAGKLVQSQTVVGGTASSTTTGGVPTRPAIIVWTAPASGLHVDAFSLRLTPRAFGWSPEYREDQHASRSAVRCSCAHPPPHSATHIRSGGASRNKRGAPDWSNGRSGRPRRTA